MSPKTPPQSGQRILIRPWTVTVTVWLRRQISMNSWNPELGGRAQMGRWDVIYFFHFGRSWRFCVFFCLKNICLDWNIPMGFKSSPMKKNASNIFLREKLFGSPFFSPSASIPVANLRRAFSSYPAHTKINKCHQNKEPFKRKWIIFQPIGFSENICDPSPEGRETAESWHIHHQILTLQTCRARIA